MRLPTGRSLLAVYTLLALVSASRSGFASAPWAKGPEIARPPLLTLPIDPERVTGEWQVTGKLATVEDEVLHRTVYEIPTKTKLTLRSKPVAASAYVVEALVRFPDATAHSGAALMRSGVVERSGKMTPAYSLTVTRVGERAFNIYPTVGDGTLWTQPLHPPLRPENNLPSRAHLFVAERFPFERISPVWNEDVRTSIENDMVKIPLAKDVWRRLRIEVRPDRVRMYHNGLLAFDEPNRTRNDGEASIELTGAARLAALEVRPLEPASSKFLAVDIGDLCNATGLVDRASLPDAGQEVLVAGKPFLFPASTPQGDHVDVGASVFRERMGTGEIGDPLKCWPAPNLLDPAMLRLRIPQAAYCRIWIIAASDDDPNSTPVLTARFYKPLKGWPIDGTTRVPAFTAQTGTSGAQKLPIRRPDGTAANLWLLPLEIDAAALSSDHREEPVLNLELTKEVKDFRAFPDPMYYGSFPAGLPSAVRVYALSLEKAPVAFVSSGNRNGNTYPFPEQPVWKVRLTNQSPSSQTATVAVEVTSPFGKTRSYGESVQIEGGGSRELEYLPELKEFGLHQVRTTLVASDHTQSREGSFLALPPDARRATPKTSRWGLWIWNGGHGTNPVAAENLQLLRALGSLIGGSIKAEDRRPWSIGPCPTLAFWAVPAWANKDPYDPAEYEKYSEECGQKVAELLKTTPDLEYVSIFAEHSISLKLTHGNPPEVFGKPPAEYTPEEKASIRAHFISAKAAFEGVRKHAPKVKFLFGHCGPLFSIPFMKNGYPKELFDGYGVDSPQFERMAERQPRAAEPSHLYFLNQEMKKQGYKKEVVHVESYYPSSHRLALGARESADSVVRTAVLSMANGTDRFLACWTLEDCEGYWGSQHYGCIGLVSRRPEYNPKPAAPAFATMTQLLDTARFDGYLPTGSRSTFCVRFKDFGKLTYCLWTIRGSRPITLQAKPTGTLERIDQHGNASPLESIDGRTTITLTPTPIWITATKTAIDKAEAGTPTYDDAPSAHRLLLDDFETADWLASDKPDERYANNSWDWERTPSPLKSQRAASPERKSTVWQVTQTEDSTAPTITGRYRVFTPARPIPLPGKAQALGIHANGNSGWGRIVYEIVDAKGEIWQNIGSKDEWNCDDTHSWSHFNFDGWRYMEFPLPGNSPGDDYREKDSVWWNHSAEGIVDLPVSLNKIIVEMPTHMLYVNELLPVENRTVELDDLVAVYESAEMMTDAPVKIQRSAVGMLKPKRTGGTGLPNPFVRLRETGVGDPTKIIKSYPPQHMYDGTRLHVSVEPVPGAKEYQIWVAAYADGRGAMVLKKGPDTEPLVAGLKPGIPLYLFATYTDAQGKQSKPTELHQTILKDEFLQK